MTHLDEVMHAREVYNRFETFVICLLAFLNVLMSSLFMCLIDIHQWADHFFQDLKDTITHWEGVEKCGLDFIKVFGHLIGK